MKKTAGFYIFIACPLLISSLIGCKSLQSKSDTEEKIKREKLTIITQEKQISYENRNLTHQDKEKLKGTIPIFTEAIKSNPGHFGAYYNRAIAYFFLQEYDRSWEDACKAQMLGANFNPEFIKALQGLKK